MQGLPFVRLKTGTVQLPLPLVRVGNHVVGSEIVSAPLKRLRIADTLACRDGKIVIGREFIRLAGRGSYYHIAMFSESEHGPSVIEMAEDHGGREVTWEQWISERDGFVDVFRPDYGGMHHYDRRGAMNWMRHNIVNQPYGHDVIRRFLRQDSWLTWWWNRPCLDENAPPPTTWVCSTAKACADKYGGGVSPVRGLWAGDVQPNDEARAQLNEYVMTVVGKMPLSLIQELDEASYGQ